MTDEQILRDHSHRAFWLPERKNRLRAALTALWGDLDLSFEILRAKLQDAYDRKPAKKTLQNFINGQAVNRSAPWLSAICKVVLEIANSLPTGRPECIHVQALDELARELDEFAPEMNAVIRQGGDTYRWCVDYLEKLIWRIPLPGPEIDILRPEFPSTNPRFPATPVIEMEVRGQKVRIKDESWNWTGSHKDRWAWEQLLIYRNRLKAILRDAKKSNKKRVYVPQLSMISNGSAAYALQALLRLWALPPLRVLVCKGRIKDRYVRALRTIGADVYESELVDEKILSEADVCDLTKNPQQDMDITSRKLDEKRSIKYYDWLICEVLEKRPRYIFCPVGTGDLFVGIIKFIEYQLSGVPRDVRIGRLTDSDLKGINVLGATTDWRGSNMDKLYARWRPSLTDVKSSIDALIEKGIIGPASGIFNLEDDAYAIDAEVMARHQGINTEYSGIAGLALLLKLLDEGQPIELEKVIVINTGWFSPVLGTLTDPQD